MNGKTRIALQALYTCLNLPNWLAVAVLRCQDLSCPRPRWEARIRRQPPPPPLEKPRLRPRFSA
ncbi:MAG: hypothetical protein J0I12_19675 [Candidatus Eremiobacteraeota bacterium]|nr:hypothetical protein [Candidatus Eremiobacteraeota bacterium]